MVLLKSVESLLSHIKDVQQDVIELSNDSLLKMSNYIEKNKLEVDEDISTALQYQDIITQQLTATIEAIDSIKTSMDRFNHAYQSDEDLAAKSLDKLQEKLNTALLDAKDKKSRFSGKLADQNTDTQDIEFF